uniref:Uncharacterized protein n=1 Tax=Calidris pygmaea TaxID=425635 RepID=A0A8C3JME3_9CHAR
RRSGLKPLEMLQDESCCSICLGIFQDPVSIHCGHSFCRSCITETWEGLTTNFSCPQCRKTKSRKILRPNRELANVIKAAKRLNLQPVREVEGGENFCEEHQEPLKLFCQDDKKLICLVCDRSKMHHDHSVVPMGEAAQECKVRGLWVCDAWRSPSRVRVVRRERKIPVSPQICCHEPDSLSTSSTDKAGPMDGQRQALSLGRLQARVVGYL